MYVSRHTHLLLTVGTLLFTVYWAYKGSTLVAAGWAFITILHIFDLIRDR